MRESNEANKEGASTGVVLKRIVMPDLCSSLSLCPGGPHCRECSHAIHYGFVSVNGRKWSFEFNSRFGPVFVNADGEPKKVQPVEKHPVWDKFSEWHDERFKA